MTGPAEALASIATESNYPTITPDGKRFVYIVQSPGGMGGSELRVRTLPERHDRALRRSARARDENRTTPHLSHEGRHVVFPYTSAPESLGPGKGGGGAAGPQQLRLLDLTRTGSLS